MRLRACTAAIGFVILSMPLVAHAATLPAHEPLAVLVVADEVNPNQLSDVELTQPEDFATALEADDSGLAIESVTTVDSQCADVALEALTGDTPPNVVVYFAHRTAKSCAGQAAQAELVAALSAGLEHATGIVVFHHGLYPDLYQAGAKDSVLQLVGGSFEGIAWNTAEGQRVFNVGGDHFVSSNGIIYEANATFAGVAAVAAGEYPYFDNIPDERYPNATLLTEADEERTVLFASNSGGERVLGYVLSRPAWQRRVVAYQPGEYQPNALDDRDGNNFQILANALYFASRPTDDPVAPAPSGSGASSSTAPSDTSDGDTRSEDASTTGDTSTSNTDSNDIGGETSQSAPTSNDASTNPHDSSDASTAPANTTSRSDSSSTSTAATTASTTTVTPSNDQSPSGTRSDAMENDRSSAPVSDGCACRVAIQDTGSARLMSALIAAFVSLLYLRRKII